MEVSIKTIERFWSKVDIKEPDQCWEWQASIGGHGYGQIAIERKPILAHRFSFYIANGHNAYVCCHTCNNKKCVNPSHLYDGDYKSNGLDAVRDGSNWQSQKTHCPQGHPYSGDNLYEDSKGHRWCRSCHLDACRRYRERSRA